MFWGRKKEKKNEREREREILSLPPTDFILGCSKILVNKIFLSLIACPQNILREMSPHDSFYST